MKMSFFSLGFHRYFSLGIDPILAQHIAHLFARDTLTLFEEKLNLDDTKDTDHFEVTQIHISMEITKYLCFSSFFEEYQFHELAIHAF